MRGGSSAGRPQLSCAAVLALITVAGCGEPSTPADAASGLDSAVVPDAPVVADIVGDWSQPPPYRAFMRFDADGTQRVARSRADLDSAPLAAGTWELSGSRLTLRNTVGACSAPATHQVGEYEVRWTADTLAFSLVDDVCGERNVIDGETWTHVP